jgi:hypothetical protein
MSSCGLEYRLVSGARSRAKSVGESPSSTLGPVKFSLANTDPVHVLPLALFVPRPCLLPYFPPPRRVISTRGGGLLSTRLAPEGFPLSRQSSRPPQPPLQGQEGFPAGGDSSAPTVAPAGGGAKRPKGQFWGSSMALGISIHLSSSGWFRSLFSFSLYPALQSGAAPSPSRPSTGFREFAGGQAGRVASPNPAGWKQTPTLAIADGVLDQQLPMEYLFSSTAPPGTGHILTAVQFAPSTSTPSSELASSWFQTALSDGRPG